MTILVLEKGNLEALHGSVGSHGEMQLKVKTLEMRICCAHSLQKSSQNSEEDISGQRIMDRSCIVLNIYHWDWCGCTVGTGAWAPKVQQC